jgi:hypothetical protein
VAAGFGIRISSSTELGDRANGGTLIFVQDSIHSGVVWPKSNKQAILLVIYCTFNTRILVFQVFLFVATCFGINIPSSGHVFSNVANN